MGCIANSVNQINSKVCKMN